MRPLPVRQRGAALVESLLAFVFLAVASLGAAQLQGQFRLHADVARQRSEAVRLGERELETLRAWVGLGAPAAALGFADIADAESTVDGETGYVGNADYRIVRRIDDGAVAGAKSAAVAVEWTDRSGQAQAVRLASVIADADPLWSGALAVGAGAGMPRGPQDRAIGVPVTARSVGGGRSVQKLSESGGVAILFDDRSGQVLARCDGIAAGTATRDLRDADLAACATGAWHLLAGTVRFSDAVPPAAADANDTPLALSIALPLVGGTYPAAADCRAEAMKTVRFESGGSLRVESVPLAALPASLGLASWTESGERFVAWRCLVPARADGRWSGRVSLVPAGWTLGSGSADRRVCRHVADLDGSGAIDANIEHPADYVDVAGALQGQNFLVVRGDQACPAGSGETLVAAASTTVPLQP